MPKVKISCSPLFILYVLLLILLGKGFFVLNYLIVLFIHEYSHAIVAAGLGYKLNNIKLAPFGICLNIDNNSIEKVDNIKIALAGPLVNLVLAFFCMSIWWLNPNLYLLSYSFVEANFVTALFNLLPCYPLDGGRIIKELLSCDRPKLIFYIVNSFFAVVFIIMFFIFGYNLSFLMIGLFIFLSVFTFATPKAYSYAVYNERKFKDITKCKSYMLNGHLPIFKLMPLLSPSNFTIFYVKNEKGIIGKIYENQIEYIIETFSPTIQLSDVVLKIPPCQKL